MIEQKPCRCLLRDNENQRPLYEIVSDVLAVMPQEQRAEPSVYDERLKRCLACTHLLNGTCMLCGCYVELRAAKRHMACPNVPPKW